MNPPRPKIALSMIVRNEARVLARCLASVKPIIHAWTVVDTGSTDGTQDLARALLGDLPGALHERPWKDFGHNRTEAAVLARGQAEYLLVVDADDVLVAPAGFVFPPLSADRYQLRVEDAGTDYWRTHLFRADLDFRYEGVVHEALTSTEPRTKARLDLPVYRRLTGGARSLDPRRYEKDARILEEALVAEPENARYVFYLARSWADAGRLDEARLAYAKRTCMAGGEEERWYAHFALARLGARMGKDDGDVIREHLRAFERRPTRAEPLSYLATTLRLRGRAAAAYPFARVARDIPRPGDSLFLDHAVYAWRAKEEHAMAALAAGRHAESLAASLELLESPALPRIARRRVERTFALGRAAVARGAPRAKPVTTRGEVASTPWRGSPSTLAR